MLGKYNASAQDGRTAMDDADCVRWRNIAQRLLPADGNTRRTPAFLCAQEEQAATPVSVQVLERPTSSTVLVQWRSTARCHYGDQLWIRGVAKRTGACALSGRPVARGDRVYYPRHGRGRQSNALAMILAAYIETESPADD